MALICCVRGNDIETIHYFVSDDLMNECMESEVLFSLPYLPDEKAKTCLCNECGRIIFFDDGGLHVTRYMCPAEYPERWSSHDAAQAQQIIQQTQGRRSDRRPICTILAIRRRQTRISGRDPCARYRNEGMSERARTLRCRAGATSKTNAQTQLLQ
ncbi:MULTISPECIES: hypothetical protein [Enorma]|uniref:hypothetical protein n=1 Tax=Enorma TaxID=1472762 RepID=UPI0012B6DE9F|nr:MULTISPECIES: hypothetical protein [Enorma]